MRAASGGSYCYVKSTSIYAPQRIKLKHSSRVETRMQIWFWNETVCTSAASLDMMNNVSACMRFKKSGMYRRKRPSQSSPSEMQEGGSSQNCPVAKFKSGHTHKHKSYQISFGTFVSFAEILNSSFWIAVSVTSNTYCLHSLSAEA